MAVNSRGKAVQAKSPGRLAVDRHNLGASVCHKVPTQKKELLNAVNSEDLKTPQLYAAIAAEARQWPQPIQSRPAKGRSKIPSAFS
jgi:hypothetical protein